MNTFEADLDKLSDQCLMDMIEHLMSRGQIITAIMDLCSYEDIEEYLKED